MKLIFVCLFIFFLPAWTYAAITINEVAWMGNSNSANDEWVELFNSGTQSVDVTGWSLSDGMNLSISLSGVIPSGAYAILERTDDASAPGPAFLIYSGGLINSGATLSLYRSDNALEDRVVGGDAWENIGGDNATKETAQYTTSGWVTAQATPGFVNVQTEDESTGDTSGDDEDTSQAETVDTTSSGSSVSTLHFIPRTLHTNITFSSRVYVNQEITFAVTSEGLAGGILNSLGHNWNFGDLSIAEGKEVKHRFKYPGEYVITVSSAYKNYQANARGTVVVLPVTFTLVRTSQGDIQIQNNAKYEIDVSGYRIQGKKEILIPEGTIMRPNATITIPKRNLEYVYGQRVVLTDEVRTVVASVGMEPAKVQQQLVSPPATSLPVLITTPVVSVREVNDALSEEVSTRSNFKFVAQETPVATSSAVGAEEQQKPDIHLQAAALEATEEIPSKKLPYLVLLSVIGLGILAVVAGKVRS